MGLFTITLVLDSLSCNPTPLLARNVKPSKGIKRHKVLPKIKMNEALFPVSSVTKVSVNSFPTVIQKIDSKRK